MFYKAELGAAGCSLSTPPLLTGFTCTSNHRKCHIVLGEFKKKKK